MAVLSFDEKVMDELRVSSQRRTNEQWIAALRSTGLEREIAITDLRAVLVRGLTYALKGSAKKGAGSTDELVEDSAQDALLRILDKFDTFEGRSQFTTWAQKIAVRTALTELRRRRWKDVSLDAVVESGGSPPAVRAPESPAAAVERSDMVRWVQRIMDEELTERQRTAIAAVGSAGMPLSEVARRMGSNRNALYKLIHDARLRIKRRLEREGITPQEILGSVGER